MIDLQPQTVLHSAKHAGSNFLIYLAACIVLAVAFTAVDTHFFTKAPSWWQARQAVGYDEPAK